MMIGMLQITRPAPNCDRRLYRWLHPMSEYANDFKYAAIRLFGFEFRWWTMRKSSAGIALAALKEQQE